MGVSEVVGPHYRLLGCSAPLSSQGLTPPLLKSLISED